MVHINIISESQITIPDHRPVRTYILRLKEVDSNLSPFKKKKSMNSLYIEISMNVQ